MKKGHLSKLALLASFTILLIPTSSTVHGKTSTITIASHPTKETNKEKPFMKAYDKNGNLIKSYSRKEIKQLNQEVLASELYKQFESNDGKPYVHYYDKNGIMIDSNDKKLLQSQGEALGKVQAAGLSVYNYKTTSFSNHVWIGGKRKFSKPQNIVVDAKKEFSLMTIEILQDYERIGSVKIGNLSDKINVPVESFTSDSGEYQIKFTSEEAKKYAISLRGGQIYYK